VRLNKAFDQELVRNLPSPYARGGFRPALFGSGIPIDKREQKFSPNEPSQGWTVSPGGEIHQGKRMSTLYGSARLGALYKIDTLTGAGLG
jgi:hypothetical protein